MTENMTVGELLAEIVRRASAGDPTGAEFAIAALRNEALPTSTRMEVAKLIVSLGLVGPPPNQHFQNCG